MSANKLNLKQIVVVDDKHGNPHGFGPGEVEIPAWALDQLKAQGTDVEKLVVKKSPASEASATNSTPAK